MKQRLLICGVIVTLLSPCTFAIKYRPDVDASAHLLQGKNYESTGRINTGTTIGTGTLIGDRWLLTAGHLIDGTAASTQVTFESSTGATSTYQVAEQYVHPLFSSVGFSPAYDIGLYKLDAPVVGIQAVELYDPSAFPSAFVPGQFDFAGYGLSGAAGATGGYDGNRRWGENWVEDFIDADGNLASDGGPVGDPAMWVSYFDGPGSGFEIGNEAIAARGDSGGGWYLDNGGSALLFAITSFSTTDFGSVIDPDGLPANGNLSDIKEPGFDDFMAGVAIGNHLDWINGTMAVPDSSSTFYLLGLGMLGLLGIRRQRR